MRRFIVFTILLICVEACSPESLKKFNPSITGEFTNLTPNSVTLSGKANLSNSTSDDVLIGILYSTSEGVLKNNSTEVIAQSFDADFNYSVIVNGLTPLTTYYYRSFIVQSSEVEYGETKSFTTPDIEASILLNDVTDLKTKTARISGAINITSSGNFSCSAKLYFAEGDIDKETLLSDGRVRELEISDKNTFEYLFEYLPVNTMYSYMVVASVDEKLIYSSVSSFSTKSFTGSITGSSVSRIELESASISGLFTHDSEDWIECEGVLYYGTEEFTAETYSSMHLSQKSFEINGSGYFNTYLNYLRPNTTYYYIIKVNAEGSSFISDVYSFTTKDFDYEFSLQITGSSPTAAFISDGFIINSVYWDTKLSIYLSETASDIATLKQPENLYKQIDFNKGVTFDSHITPLKVSTKYYYLVEISFENAYTFDTGVLSFETHTPEGIDLGLPSGNLWASTDLSNGSRPDYFAWGEIYAYEESDPNNERNYNYNKRNTNPFYSDLYRKHQYNEDTYIFGDTSYPSGEKLTKYNRTDDLGRLEDCDDAANVRWGGNWHIPTVSDWNELITNCYWDYSDGTFTITGPNGNKITLESHGEAESSYDYFYYWTSVQANEYVDAKCASRSWSGGCAISSKIKHAGLPIRPVLRQ